MIGQKLREMVGDQADAWVEPYGGVLRSGEPVRFEQELVATGRHLALSAFRVDPPELKQVAVLFGPSPLETLRGAGPIDLLITDVGLPGGLNGRQVADAARAFNPEMSVLFITGYAENAALNHGHIERGMEVLTKPFALADLTTRAVRLLEGRRA